MTKLPTAAEVRKTAEELRLSREHFVAVEYRTDAQDMLAAIEMLLQFAELLERERWIPVTERLPDLDAEVEAVNSDGLRTVRRWERKSDGEWFWASTCMDSCGCCDSFDDNITHWREYQPLPQPPEGE